MNDLKIINRVDAVLHMDDLSILKCSQHMDDPVHCLDVGQESISQPLSLCSTPARYAGACKTTNIVPSSRSSAEAYSRGKSHQAAPHLMRSTIRICSGLACILLVLLQNFQIS